ncbi:MAG: hypothetical protein CL912_32215 [Deltaproteobacteria bacterium]|nr:hypothetical protein [Deltaproteobacteria bacterium]
MAANEEHGPGELKEIVEDEMASYAGGSLDLITVLGEEMPHVTDLGEEESEPGKLAYDSDKGIMRVSRLKIGKVAYQYNDPIKAFKANGVG